MEQAFGMLVGRWGILWRPLRCSPRKKAGVIVTYCKPHKCIVENGRGATLPPPSWKDEDGNTEPAECAVHLQDNCDLDTQIHRPCSDLDASAIRESIMQQIDDLRRCRPPRSYRDADSFCDNV